MSSTGEGWVGSAEIQKSQQAGGVYRELEGATLKYCIDQSASKIINMLMFHNVQDCQTLFRLDCQSSFLLHLDDLLQ